MVSGRGKVTSPLAQPGVKRTQKAAVSHHDPPTTAPAAGAVFGYKHLTEEQFAAFDAQLRAAKLATEGRADAIAHGVVPRRILFSLYNPEGFLQPVSQKMGRSLCHLTFLMFSSIIYHCKQDFGLLKYAHISIWLF